MANEYDIKIKSENDTRWYSLRTSFRTYFMRGTYEKLLAPASVKEYIKNENRLRNGAQYFTAAKTIKYQTRTLAMQCLIDCSTQSQFLASLKSLQNYLMRGAIYLSVPRLDTIFKLVYTGTSNLNIYRLEKATFTLNFVEPDVTDREVISEKSAMANDDDSEESEETTENT